MSADRRCAATNHIILVRQAKLYGCIGPAHLTGRCAGVLGADAGLRVQRSRSPSRPPARPLTRAGGNYAARDRRRIGSRLSPSRNRTDNVPAVRSRVRLTNGYSMSMETSFDTVESSQVGSALLVVTPGSQSTLISQDLGPLVRPGIKSTEAFAMVAIMSVWLQPKST